MNVASNIVTAAAEEAKLMQGHAHASSGDCWHSQAEKLCAVHRPGSISAGIRAARLQAAGWEAASSMSSCDARAGAPVTGGQRVQDVGQSRC